MKVALISPDGWGLDLLRDHLARAGLFASREFHGIGELAKLRSGEFDLLILRLESFSRAALHGIERLRSFEKQAGLLTVVSSVEPTLRFEARNLAKHILLEAPGELRDLAAAVDSLALGRRARARLHPRISRADALTVSGAERNMHKFEGYFVDYAQMGARLVLDGKPGFAENQSIVVEYRSSVDRTRVHKVHSKISWVKECKSEHTLLGVRFIASA